MRFYPLLLILIAPVFTLAQDQKMETRYYPVDPAQAMQVTPANNENPFGRGVNQLAENDYLVNLFKRYGVEFPEGASLVYEPLIAQLVAVNTPQNLETIESILQKSDVDMQQVYIDIWAVSFPSDGPQELERELGRPLRDKEYFDLWKKGGGRRTFSQGIRTVNGVNAIIETGKVSNPDGAYDRILNVTPTVGPQGVINLLVSPAYAVSQEQKKEVKVEEMPWELTTCVVLKNEDAIVLGHSSTQNGSQRIVIFLAARTTEVLWKSSK